jgi:hypothetical protein
MLLKKLHLCFFGAALATSVLTTGCQPAQDTSQPAPAAAQPAPAPAQPAPAVAEAPPSETVIYNKWEVETHRAHRELNQRVAKEQKEYREWREKHPNGR